MEEKIEVGAKYLEETLKSAATKVVGEVMSDFETITNLAELKQSVKNTIYQNFRDIHGQIKAFNSGVKFISSPKTTE